MTDSTIVASSPWYRSLSREQRRVLFSLEPWPADRRVRDLCALSDGGFRAPPAARSLFADPALRWLCAGNDSIRPGDRRGHRRHPRRLYRPQADDDAGGTRLCPHHGVERDCLELRSSRNWRQMPPPILFYPYGITCWQPSLKGLTVMVNSIYNGSRFKDSVSRSSTKRNPVAVSRRGREKE